LSFFRSLPPPPFVSFPASHLHDVVVSVLGFTPLVVALSCCFFRPPLSPCLVRCLCPFFVRLFPFFFPLRIDLTSVRIIASAAPFFSPFYLRATGRRSFSHFFFFLPRSPRLFFPCAFPPSPCTSFFPAKGGMGIFRWIPFISLFSFFSRAGRRVNRSPSCFLLRFCQVRQMRPHGRAYVFFSSFPPLLGGGSTAVFFIFFSVRVFSSLVF